MHYSEVTSIILQSILLAEAKFNEMSTGRETLEFHKAAHLLTTAILLVARNWKTKYDFKLNE